MNLNFFLLDGYGVFVWPAFIFTFLSCSILYLKTYKEFKKQEKLYFAKFGKKQFYSVKTSEPEDILSKIPII